VSTSKKGLDWIKDGATYVFRLAKRIATLEERVTALENALKTMPPDACPFCGERAMQMIEAGTYAKGPGPKKWWTDVWKCQAGGKEQERNRWI
jgi:hypothetical protein